MQEKPKHGGARKGAGRKPRSEAREALTLRVESHIAERFRKLCQSRNRSQADQFSDMVKRARIKPEQD